MTYIQCRYVFLNNCIESSKIPLWISVSVRLKNTVSLNIGIFGTSVGNIVSVSVKIIPIPHLYYPYNKKEKHNRKNHCKSQSLRITIRKYQYLIFLLDHKQINNQLPSQIYCRLENLLSVQQKESAKIKIG